MAEEFIIKLVSNDFSAGVSSSGAASIGTSSGKSSGVGSIGKMAGALGAIGLGVQTIISIVGPVINSLIKPIKTVLTGILKLVGELLRPIVEIVVILLRPVLALLKPIISIFKAFMAPFIQIAREFANIGTKQIQGGDIAGGMENIVSAITTLIGPFVVSITSVALQLATSLLLGGITLLVSSLMDQIGNILENSSIGFISDIGTSLKDGSEVVKNAGKELTTDVNSLITDGTNFVLGEMEKTYKEKLDDAKNNISPNMTDAYVTPLEEATKSAQGAADIVFGEEGTLVKSVEKGTTNMGVEVDNKMGENGTIPTKFETGLTYMESSTYTFVDYMKRKGEELVEEAQNYASSIRRSAKREAELIRVGPFSLDVDVE